MDLGSSRIANIIAAAALALALLGLFVNRAALESLWPLQLGYQTKGIICDKDRCNLKVVVRNRGWLVQENVRVEAPDTTSKFTYFYASRSYERIKNLDREVFDLGRIHPGSLRLVIFSYPISTKFEFDTYDDHEHLVIYSKQTEATYDRFGKIAEFLPDWLVYVYGSFFGLILLFAILRFFGPPYVKFMSFSWDLHYAQKELAKSRKTVSKIQHKLSEIPDETAETAINEMKKRPCWLRPQKYRD